MGWAHAVGPDGKVTGLEFSPEYGKLAEEAMAANGVKNVEIIIGDALEK
jgi:predicted O-methyltransferase YrrM